VILKTYAAVMVGGALGTGLRLWLSTWMASRYGDGFPIGTITVNVAGCFIAGAFSSLSAPAGWWPASEFTRQVVIVGMLGGFTTFSAFSLQTLSLCNAGEWGRAGLNVLASIVLCLLAVWVGYLLARTLNPR
jgi:fluoride exporter